jgi:hemerythrin superfamily protein
MNWRFNVSVRGKVISFCDLHNINVRVRRSTIPKRWVVKLEDIGINIVIHEFDFCDEYRGEFDFYNCQIKKDHRNLKTLLSNLLKELRENLRKIIERSKENLNNIPETI